MENTETLVVGAPVEVIAPDPDFKGKRGMIVPNNSADGTIWVQIPGIDAPIPFVASELKAVFQVGETVTVTTDDYNGKTGPIDAFDQFGAIWVTINKRSLPFSPDFVEKYH